MLKFFLFVLGFILMLMGFTTIILYINLLSFGYNFKEYICFIIKLPEFYYLIIGFIIINFCILKGRKKHEASL